MVLQRDFAIVFVSLAIAAALYVLSFRDLAVANPAPAGSLFGATLLQPHDDPSTDPALAG